MGSQVKWKEKNNHSKKIFEPILKVVENFYKGLKFIKKFRNYE